MAVALLLGFLLRSGLLPVRPVRQAVFPRKGLQGSDCGRLLNRVGKTSVDWVESLWDWD